MRIKFIWLFLFLSLLFPCLVLGGSIDWIPYEKGIIEAREQDKPIFLHFSADWCGYCRQMEKKTFQDDDVISYLNEHFVSIKVDTDAQQAIARAQRVTGLPDNRFMDKNGMLAYRVPGFIDPVAFAFFLEYIHSKAYKTMDPMTYYKSKKAK